MTEGATCPKVFSEERTFQCSPRLLDPSLTTAKQLEDSVIQDLTTLLKFLLMNTLNHDRKPE
jgi:hypothetical protein